MLDPSDTIVAISSPAGPAPRGIVRLSGPRALEIALEGFQGGGSTPIPRRPSTLSGLLRLDDPAAVLPVTLVVWPGPRSYTGQPVAEIHTIGSPPLLDHLLARCLARGCRRAERGEFTLRAFLAGRIDLAQSEAVLRVIEARSPAQLEGALRELAGGLAGPVRAVRDRLLERLVELEANLDFVDEADIPPVARRALIDDLAASARGLTVLIDRHRARDRSGARPRVVLAGAPNTGKSRLFNALLDDDRAIVAPLAGTTRDDVTADTEFDGLAIELVDTAGEEPACSPIAAAAQARRADLVTRADLVLRCIPADGSEAGTIRPSDPRTMPILSKADLAARPAAPDVIATSAITGLGLASLRSAIAERLRSIAAGDGSDRAIGPESRDALERASGSVAAALALATERASEELIAVELRQAIDDLGMLVGAVVSEDILDRIFRRFCVGK